MPCRRRGCRGRKETVVLRSWSLSLAVLAVAVAGGLLTSPVSAGSAVSITTEVVTDGSDVPTFLTQAPGDASRLFFTERDGRIRIVLDGELLPGLFVDLSSIVNSGGPEGSLGGLAFHPDYQDNGLFYVAYTNLDSDSVLAELTVTGNPNVADIASLRILLTFPELGPTHNIGWIGFGPDGYLYVAKGDGGNNTAGVFAQDIESLFGKILRLDPCHDDFPADPDRNYGIPPTNPFVGVAGRDEIWSLGLRNPWRCSFDRGTGDLWISDVGQSSWEEISFQPAASTGGDNYGWNCMEGSSCHLTGCTCNAPTLTNPVYEYDHLTGCAVIGGYVYRGSALPELQGLYLFADICAGKVWAYDISDDTVVQVLGNASPYSFGEDLDGELYLLSTINIRKIVFFDCNDNGVPDTQDIADLTSPDCNLDSVPDECQADCNGNSIPDDCDLTSGTSFDNNGNGIPDECDEQADFDGDGVVGITDLLFLLGVWGDCPAPPTECPADLNDDGVVGINDFLLLLGRWG
jgi:glucose/arabinose dehydrogenase